ncbi:deoxyribose-phosphate aldolase [Nitritalea halalkaliphila LW7]|uniref:Deoxyribose-phosphate aldolase n=1 Tax=Nitritalea halalkaliphila LW7 TaxID=1189621 RepID=I5BVW0_9BACT|nr:deoxyribose-phosphate aldolase [Nitritalea halalkaliphila LW7]
MAGSWALILLIYNPMSMEINMQEIAALAQTIEHTALKPDLDAGAIERLVDEAKAHGLFGVCVPPFWVKKAKRDIGTSPVQLVTVVGFPLGYQQTEVKMLETELALKHGADEIDVVWSLSAFKAGMTWPKIELAKLAKCCHEQEKLLKVIVETAYLSEEELKAACVLCADAGVDFVKTSTGFARRRYGGGYSYHARFSACACGNKGQWRHKNPSGCGGSYWLRGRIGSVLAPGWLSFVRLVLEWGSFEAFFCSSELSWLK